APQGREGALALLLPALIWGFRFSENRRPCLSAGAARRAAHPVITWDLNGQRKDDLYAQIDDLLVLRIRTKPSDGLRLPAQPVICRKRFGQERQTDPTRRLFSNEPITLPEKPRTPCISL